MRFFNEQDFISYRDYLIKTVNEAAATLAEQDHSIKAILIGEFPDGRCRFVTVHPFIDAKHKHRPELDHYASLMLDLAPEGMSMYVMEIDQRAIANCGTAGDNH